MHLLRESQRMLWVSELSTNQTDLYPASFILVGIPGLEEHHCWIAAVFGLMYLVALLGNFFLLFLVVTERVLRRQPMFLFLALLAMADILLSSSTAPKTLAVLWSTSQEISFEGCLAQMFFTHVSFIAESTILLAMAFDRYVAICHPLRYVAILTPSAVAKIGIVALARGICVMLPTIFLLRRLTYCGRRVMPHSYCEHMGIARMACVDIALNIWYGFTTTLLCPGMDSLLIVFSYLLILRSVFRLPSGEARLKALGTCGSHLCVILLFYTPAFFSFFAHRFGHGLIPQHLLILLANLYQLLPPMLNPVVYAVRTKALRQRVVWAWAQAGKLCC